MVMCNNLWVHPKKLGRECGESVKSTCARARRVFTDHHNPVADAEPPPEPRCLQRLGVMFIVYDNVACRAARVGRERVGGIVSEREEVIGEKWRHKWWARCT